MPKSVKPIELEDVVVRFSGDSGDGMQLTGTLFSESSAELGNEISTFPDYPADIRAPRGTIGGVSGFQVHLGKKIVHTPGDVANVLIAMNPAALKANKAYLKPGGTIILDVDAFTDKNLEKAGYKTMDPIVEDQLADFNIVKAPITTMTAASLKEFGFDNKTVLRSKNMYALGLVSWLFNQPLNYIEKKLNRKFKKKPEIAEANIKVLQDGFNYGENIQAMTPSYMVGSGKKEKGTYRNINGNQAVAWGFLAASEKSGKELFLGSYPITPATEILQELSGRKDLGVKVFQAEDEIAGISTAIGASFAGDLAVTTTSGPGLALKGEAIGLAVMAELPLVVVDVQRGGPSTGLPTKTEQSDLRQALYGRNGESPAIVIAASTPSDCFHYAFMAAKLSMEHMTPVILLTDGFLANGSQPWRIPSMDELPAITPPMVTPEMKDSWEVMQRDAARLNRYWATPGTPGFSHRVGGLEKDYTTGAISHNPANHQKMVDVRQEKVQKVAEFIPEQKVLGDVESDILMVGWGGTYGHLTTAFEELHEEGIKVAYTHFNYIMPLPVNTAEIMKKYKKIVVCEINKGQFADYLRMTIPGPVYHQFNRIEGLPFAVEDIKNEIKKYL
ncbi:2-oxoacid:acceptor oxidoreductase subunit alpha [Saccharicrinis sp. FJH54]|uniref:2-oxoacid:acceptor oxidoreductase subunit alpha n=1 Tax=Saccharicrinis sp. FJH54 TaxID=3344665 RepID=UPI0035D3DF9F